MGTYLDLPAWDASMAAVIELFASREAESASEGSPSEHWLPLTWIDLASWVAYPSSAGISHTWAFTVDRTLASGTVAT
jgi:hypothetical protein